jgi:medium-chain acyl-[acyl-carrier-protein] hydrolase
MALAGPWLVTWPRTRPADVRLLCIPHAGGGAAPFRAWSAWVPEEVEVCAVRLPGRESRVRERPIDDLPTLVEVLADALAPVFVEPFALFGHCSGALIAFELARRLARAGGPKPVRLVAASQAAPHMRGAGASTDPSLGLRERLRRLGDTDSAMLENDELYALLEPGIAADFRLADRYRYERAALLDVPVTVVAGADDVHVGEESLRAWERESYADVELVVARGGHLFGGEAWRQLAQLTAAAVLRSQAASETPSSSAKRAVAASSSRSSGSSSSPQPRT